MNKVSQCKAPDNSLLNRYDKNGDYTDCYRINVSRDISFNRFMTSFYTTKLFRIERFILKWIARKPSSDGQLINLIEGRSKNFSAWHIEDRCENQILLCDFQNKTRSWLMIEKIPDSDDYKTRLYFGSAVVASNKDGKKSFGLFFNWAFKLLFKFHHFYSIALLSAAKSSLNKNII